MTTSAPAPANRWANNLPAASKTSGLPRMSDINRNPPGRMRSPSASSPEAVAQNPRRKLHSRPGCSESPQPPLRSQRCRVPAVQRLPAQLTNLHSTRTSRPPVVQPGRSATRRCGDSVETIGSNKPTGRCGAPCHPHLKNRTFPRKIYHFFRVMTISPPKPGPPIPNLRVHPHRRQWRHGDRSLQMLERQTTPSPGTPVDQSIALPPPGWPPTER